MVSKNDQIDERIDSKIINKLDQRRRMVNYIITSSHAVTIQSVWRGRLARIRKRNKSLARISTGLSDDFVQLDNQNDKQINNQLDNKINNQLDNKVDDKTIKLNNKRIEYFNQSDRIDSIDCKAAMVLGLPELCSVSRLTGRVISSNRQSIDKQPNISYSELSSDVINPTHSLICSYSVDDLDPSSTLVIRVDTLERPSLKTRCVGYSSIKLFIDHLDKQPDSSANKQAISVNVGRYLLPVNRGSIPSDGPLTEELVDSMDRIPDCYVYLIIRDSKSKDDSSINSLTSLNEYLSTHPLSNEYRIKHSSEGTVLSTLLLSYPTAYLSTKSFDLPALTYTPELHNYTINQSNDKNIQVDSESIERWVKKIFPSNQSSIDLIDSRFIRRYNDQSIVTSEAIALHNMPKPLIQSINHAIRLYRTSVTYLSTNLSTNQTTNLFSRVNSQSCESSPMYLKSNVKPLESGIANKTTCILVQVIAVDVNLPNDSTKYRNKQCLPSQLIDRLELLSDDNDDRNWWGLIPLMIKAPGSISAGCLFNFSYLPTNEPINSNVYNAWFINSGDHAVPLFRGRPPKYIIQSKDPWNQFLQSLNRQTCSENYRMKNFRTSIVPSSIIDYDGTLLRLTHGSSAIIRITNKQIVNQLVNEPSQSTIIEISNYLYTNDSIRQAWLINRFSYYSLRDENRLSLQALICYRLFYNSLSALLHSPSSPHRLVIAYDLLDLICRKIETQLYD